MDCKRPELKNRKSKTYEKTMEWVTQLRCVSALSAVEGLKKTHAWVAESTTGVISICPRRVTKEQKALGIKKGQGRKP